MKSKLSTKLGLRIKELRTAKNIKQCELADMLNMERSNLTRIENGKQRPTDENLEKIANILNVEIKELFDYNHIKPKQELINSIQSMLNNLEEKELQYIYKTIENVKQLR